MTDRSAKDIARQELYLVERENRPWQDDEHLIDVLRAERTFQREHFEGNAVEGIVLAAVLSFPLWLALWWAL